MVTKVQQWGNSLGVRIPKGLAEEAEVSAGSSVEISVEGGSLIVRPVTKARANWAAAFQKMAHRGDDALLDEVPPGPSGWDKSEWEWR